MRYLVVIGCALILAGCGDAPAPAPAEADGPVTAKVAPTAETIAKLAAADRKDGKEDKVISLCPS